MKYKAKIIMGSALGLAAIAVTLDHTRYRVPVPTVIPEGTRESATSGNPCGLGAPSSPCGLGGQSSPCGLGGQSSPCGLGAPSSPCGLGAPSSPCSLGS